MSPTIQNKAQIGKFNKKQRRGPETCRLALLVRGLPQGEDRLNCPG
jgi:hypothetical protein